MSDVRTRPRSAIPGISIPLYRLGDFALSGAFMFFTSVRVIVTADSLADGQQLEALHHAATGVFMAICAFLFLIRGPAKAGARSWVPKAVAVIGTWSIVPLLQQPFTFDSNAVLLVSSLGILAGEVFIIWAVWTLRRSLSIFPEARDLVRHGPYGIVRHPLYSAHMLTYALVLLPRFAPLALLFAFLGIAGELWRARNEEAVLSSAFPVYEAYAETTPRFIPRLTGRD